MVGPPFTTLSSRLFYCFPEQNENLNTFSLHKYTPFIPTVHYNPALFEWKTRTYIFAFTEVQPVTVYLHFLKMTFSLKKESQSDLKKTE